MKNKWKWIALIVVALCAFYGCKKTDFRDEPSAREIPSEAKPGLTETKTAQSIMCLLDFSFPYLKNGELSVDIDLTLASESVVLNKQFPLTGKCSFSLVDSSGGSRISGLQFSYDDGPWTPLPYTLVRGCQYPDSVHTTSYDAYQSFGTATAFLKNGLTIGSILAGDDAPGNDNVCGNADVARAHLTVSVASALDHWIYVKGMVKGNEAFGYLGFTYDTCTCTTPFKAYGTMSYTYGKQ